MRVGVAGGEEAEGPRAGGVWVRGAGLQSPSPAAGSLPLLCSTRETQPVSESGLRLAQGGQQAGEEPQAASQTHETRAWRRGAGGRSPACESRPERAGTIGLRFLRRPPVAREARLALIPASLPSSSQTGSKVSGWFVVGVFSPQRGSWWWCAVALCEG